MRNASIALAIALISLTILAMPASAQSVPALPVVGHVDTDPYDGFQQCERVAGINACVIVLGSDCTVWVSASFGGCFIR